MKKIINMLLYQLNTKVIKSIFLIIIVYQFIWFFQFINSDTKYNLYDLWRNQFSYLNLFIFVSIMTLIIIYNIYGTDDFNKYLSIRFKSKTEVYNMKVISSFLVSLIIILFMNIISVLQSIGNTSFKNEWSDYFYITMTGNVNLIFDSGNISILTKQMTPLIYLIYSNSLVLLYLFFICLLFNVSNLWLKKRAYSFILNMLLIGISMAMDLNMGIIRKVTFTYNIFFINTDTNDLRDGNYIIIRIIYWVLVISFVYIVGRIKNRKSDYDFSECYE